jgi:hypothetical protein
MEHIVFLERKSVDAEVRRPAVAHEWREYEVSEQSEVIERLAGAGVDVLSNEPPREGNPLLELELPNLVVTPHVAWASRESMQSLADQLIDNIEAFVRGEPVNVVNSKS